MIFSRICALGTTYDIFPVSELPSDTERYKDERDGSVVLAFLLPSADADAEVIVPGATAPSPSAALAASLFLGRVRGLPLDEYDLLSSGKIYRVRYDSENDNYCVLMPKCKLLSSNTRIFVNEMPLLVSLMQNESELISVSECSDAEHFTDLSLRRIYTELRPHKTSGAVAFSISEDGVMARGFFPQMNPERVIDVAVAVASILRVGTARASLLVHLRDSTLVCRAQGQYLSVCGENIAPLTFSAPDIL